MPSYKVGTLVQVDWLDAEADATWVPIKDVSTKPTPVRSVGFVLQDNEGGITLAGDVGLKWDPEETVNRTMCIPKGMVTRIRKLAT